MRARSQEEFVEVTKFILQECIVVHIAEVTSASDTETNSGSREEHTRGAGSVASRSKLWYASTTAREADAACDADCGLVPQITEEIMEVINWHDGSSDFLGALDDPQFFVIDGWVWRSRREFYSQLTRFV